MSKGMLLYLLYQKDFSERGKDRFFIYDGSLFSEVNSKFVVSLDCFVVTHDFWLISNSLYKEHEILPKKVIDVVLLSKIVAGTKQVAGDVQPWDISRTIKPLFNKQKDFNNYIDAYYRRKELVLDEYMLFSHKLADYYGQLAKSATETKEVIRFYATELPIFNALTISACRGIRLDEEVVLEHKTNLKIDFYRQLKVFAEKHNVLYEIPSEGEVKDKLRKLKYNVDDYSLEFLIDFLPSTDGYTDDLRALQKTNKSYKIFNIISSNAKRLNPIVETHWTSTSRIYHKSPNLQNISKKYRNIFLADEKMSLSYVDYDQFEVGIMAALSNDPKMKKIYEDKDAYEDFAMQVFGNKGMRKKAKVMFLSYTYGMSLENICISIRELKGDTKEARNYFEDFGVFESWKETIYEDFKDNGRISTIDANYLNRKLDGELSNKEKRTCVNHVIQGTASYIFKRALLELSKVDGLEVLVPMHDAVLFQYTKQVDPKLSIRIFEQEMTCVLLGKVKGKASIEEFYQA